MKQIFIKRQFIDDLKKSCKTNPSGDLISRTNNRYVIEQIFIQYVFIEDSIEM